MVIYQCIASKYVVAVDTYVCVKAVCIDTFVLLHWPTVSA